MRLAEVWFCRAVAGVPLQVVVMQVPTLGQREFYLDCAKACFWPYFDSPRTSYPSGL